jgi:hypothetical protein
MIGWSELAGERRGFSAMKEFPPVDCLSPDNKNVTFGWLESAEGHIRRAVRQAADYRE